MTLQEALHLDAKAFWQNEEIVLAIQTVLNPGPWIHGPLYSYEYPFCWPSFFEAGFKCSRCHAVRRNRIYTHGFCKWVREHPASFCPVPPPLEEEPEVVARRLREIAKKYKCGFAFEEALYTIAAMYARRVKQESWKWLAIDAPTHIETLISLLALGQIKTEKEI